MCELQKLAVREKPQDAEEEPENTFTATCPLEFVWYKYWVFMIHFLS